jgi:hypothetical protein
MARKRVSRKNRVSKRKTSRRRKHISKRVSKRKTSRRKKRVSKRKTSRRRNRVSRRRQRGGGKSWRETYEGLQLANIVYDSKFCPTCKNADIAHKETCQLALDTMVSKIQEDGRPTLAELDFVNCLSSALESENK